MATSKSIKIRIFLSILLRIVGGIWAMLGVFAGTSSSYGGSDAIDILITLTFHFLLFIFPGLTVMWMGSAIAEKKVKHESQQRHNKTFVIVSIIGKSFLLATSIFFFIFGLSLFVGGNLGPIVGVVYGSIASLAFFIYFLIAWILRARGFSKMRAYSIAFVVICLTPVVYFAVAFSIHLIR